MTTHLDRITAKDGYLFIALEPVGQTARELALAGTSGDESIKEVCMRLLAMFDLKHLKDVTKIRCIVGDKTIHVERTPLGRAVVALPKGHPQGKSAARVLRRTIRLLRPTRAVALQPIVPRETIDTGPCPLVT